VKERARHRARKGYIMPPLLDQETRSFCRDNFKKGNITLYLGAGVSIDNNIPSWEKLVLAMYFSTISEQKLHGWRPFSNYLYAIAEWYLEDSSEPLEITARKLRKFYETRETEEAFLSSLYSTLYGSMLDEYGEPYSFIDGDFVLSQNSTLRAVAKLCESNERGINSVITYNYDNLLELSLGNSPNKAIYAPDQRFDDELPIFHVHGYVPLDRNTNRSRGEDIVFTEDQYHRVSSNAYDWSNLIQLQKMSNSVGVMVGLSLSDRNMRRLLDAVGSSPINSRNFALLKKPDKMPPEDEVLDDIHENAKQLLEKFRDSGIKSAQTENSGIFFPNPGIKSDLPGIKSSRSGQKGPRYRHEISGIIEEVKRLDLEQKEYVLDQLRIKPIWFKEYSEIPKILKDLLLAD